MNPHQLSSFFPWRFYTLLDQYFSHQNVGLLISHVSKILEDLADFVTILSQLSNFLSSLSQGCAPKTYQRWAVSSWNVDSWRSHTQFVTKKDGDRRGYIKENYHPSTNLDVSVLMFALEIAKVTTSNVNQGTGHIFKLLLLFYINQDPPWDWCYDQVSTTSDSTTIS